MNDAIMSLRGQQDSSQLVKKRVDRCNNTELLKRAIKAGATAAVQTALIHCQQGNIFCKSHSTQAQLQITEFSTTT